MPDMERLQQQLRMRVRTFPPLHRRAERGLGVEAESLSGQLAEYFRREGKAFWCDPC